MKTTKKTTKKQQVTVKKVERKGKNKEPPRLNQQGVLLSMGNLDLILRFEFTDEDLEIPEDKDSSKHSTPQYYRIENFNSISDLQFMENRPELWNKIRIIPNNHTLKQLLLAIKSTKAKYFIDYIPFGRPDFTGDEEFFGEIFNYCTERGGLYVNRTEIGEAGHTLRFEFTHKGKMHCFGADRNDYEKNFFDDEKEDSKNQSNSKNNEDSLDDEERKKKEIREQREREREREEERQKQEEENQNSSSNQNEQSSDEEKNQNNNEDSYAPKEQKVPTFTRSNCAFSKMEPLCVKYDWFFVNYEDLNNFKGDYTTKDLVELVYFLKKKGCKTFINFYQNAQEEEEDDDKYEKGEEDMGIAKENFNSGPNNYAMSKNVEEEEEEKEVNEVDDENDEMKLMNNLYYVVEAYFFDTKQAVDIFDEHYQYFRNDKKNKKNKKNRIDRRKVFDYFIKGIASGTRDEVDGNKFGFFMDNFKKYDIINCSKKKAKKLEFDCQLHPKINHNNIDVINEYKKIIRDNKDYYISLFIAFLLGGIASTKVITTELILTSFLNAIEIIKRKIECTKNHVVINENNIMKYRLSEKAIAEQIKKLTEGDQENGFILDCVNKEKSSLKDYVALYDYHLVHYLSNFLVQRELKNKGFIDKDGYIMYDKEYKKVMGAPINQKPRTKQQIDKKVIKSIKQIDVATRLKDKEIDSKEVAMRFSNKTEKKIPTAKYCLPTKKEEKKTQKEGKKK